MSHDNRSRISVDIPGKPNIYQPFTMPGWEVIGTVRRGDGDVGALLKNQHTGIFVQANAGVIKSLDQRKAEAALWAVKRK